MSLVSVFGNAGVSLPHRLIPLCYSLLTLAFVSHADVKIIEPPEKEIFVSAGKTAVIPWNYTVDNRNVELNLVAFEWSVAVPPYSSTKKTIKQELRDGTRLDGSDVPNSLKNRTNVRGKATLEITDVTRNDSNTYYFEVVTTLAVGTISSSVNLTVTVPPIVKVSEKYIVFGLSESRTVTCEATGVPAPKITWTRWGRNKPLPSATGSVVGGAYSNITLVGDLETEGEYICTAILQTGEMSNASAHIIVEYFSAPDYSLKRNCCPASGFPQPIYQWTFPNGSLLSTETSKCLSGDSLKSGKYICRASSSKGHFQDSATFYSRTSPPIEPPPEGFSKVTIRWTEQEGDEYYNIVAKEGNMICYISTGKARQTVIDYDNLDACRNGATVNLEVNVWVQTLGAFEKVGQVNATIEPTSSAVRSHQVGFIQLVAPLTMFLLTVLFQ